MVMSDCCLIWFFNCCIVSATNNFFYYSLPTPKERERERESALTNSDDKTTLLKLWLRKSVVNCHHFIWQIVASMFLLGLLLYYLHYYYITCKKASLIFNNINSTVKNERWRKLKLNFIFIIFWWIFILSSTLSTATKWIIFYQYLARLFDSKIIASLGLCSIILDSNIVFILL